MADITTKVADQFTTKAVPAKTDMITGVNKAGTPNADGYYPEVNFPVSAFQPDCDETDADKPGYVANQPIIEAANVSGSTSLTKEIVKDIDKKVLINRQKLKVLDKNIINTSGGKLKIGADDLNIGDFYLRVNGNNGYDLKGPYIPRGLPVSFTSDADWTFQGVARKDCYGTTYMLAMFYNPFSKLYKPMLCNYLAKTNAYREYGDNTYLPAAGFSSYYDMNGNRIAGLCHLNGYDFYFGTFSGYVASLTGTPAFTIPTEISGSTGILPIINAATETESMEFDQTYSNFFYDDTAKKAIFKVYNLTDAKYYIYSFDGMTFTKVCEMTSDYLISAMRFFGDNLYIAGNFTTFETLTTSYIVKYDSVTSAFVAITDANITEMPKAIAVNGTTTMYLLTGNGPCQLLSTTDGAVYTDMYPVTEYPQIGACENIKFENGKLWFYQLKKINFSAGSYNFYYIGAYDGSSNGTVVNINDISDFGGDCRYPDGSFGSSDIIDRIILDNGTTGLIISGFTRKTLSEENTAIYSNWLDFTPHKSYTDSCKQIDFTNGLADAMSVFSKEGEGLGLAILGGDPTPNMYALSVGYSIAAIGGAYAQGLMNVAAVDIRVSSVKGGGFAGAWVSGANYSEYSIVTDESITYRAKSSVALSTIAPASDTDHWEVYPITQLAGFNAQYELVLADPVDVYFMAAPYIWWDTTWKEYQVTYSTAVQKYYKCTNDIETATGLRPEADTSNWSEISASEVKSNYTAPMQAQWGTGFGDFDIDSWGESSSEATFIDTATEPGVIKIIWATTSNYFKESDWLETAPVRLFCNNAEAGGEGMFDLMQTSPDKVVFSPVATGMGSKSLASGSRADNCFTTANKFAANAAGLASVTNFQGANAHASSCEVQLGEDMGEIVSGKLQQTEDITCYVTTSGTTTGTLNLMSMLSIFAGMTVPSPIAIPSGAVFRFDASIVGMETTTGADVAFTVKGAINTKLATPALTWSNVATDYIDTNLTGATVAVALTDGALAISCTGVADKTIKWVAAIRFTEVR